ncbi:uncharacterized protein LOC133497641 isoform X3 [Syngnathoides biaculeatus]|uniref:uncharacterized protein LOC133497641 isoform X3 n=1 Tax=Syngnathoides biaculeatus TaxID=300417 RepID=UPI002ADDB769|nr:uncharacterized protein LOC133497641 isoform X3 [Syngnathoides biaculeatus]
MCKVEAIRALLNARLSAAVEEICLVLRRTVAEYEEELCLAKKENERQRQQLDAVCRLRGEPRTAGKSRDLHVEQGEEGPQPAHVKQEEREDEISTLQLAGAILKREDDDGDRRRGFQSEGRSAPPSDTDAATSRSAHNDDGS